jgi:hypothetical protein
MANKKPKPKASIKSSNKNVVNIKIINSKRGKGGRQMRERPKQGGGSYLYQTLYPQTSQPLIHYNRVQDANLSTLVNRERESIEHREREKSLNSHIHSLLASKNHHNSDAVSEISHSERSEHEPLYQSRTTNLYEHIPNNRNVLLERNIITEKNHNDADNILHKYEKDDDVKSNSKSYNRKDNFTDNSSIETLRVPRRRRTHTAMTVDELRTSALDMGISTTYVDEQGRTKKYSKKELKERMQNKK